MVQTFMVVQCVSCELFQVQQVKKSSNKWTCKVCTTKQSVIKKYYEGQAADCRKHVQQFNMKKGERERDNERSRLLMPPDEYESFKEEVSAEDTVTLKHLSPPAIVQADKSKWSLYVQPKDDDDEENEDEVHNPQGFERAPKKVKRNASIPSLDALDSHSNPYSQIHQDALHATSLYSLDRVSNASAAGNKKQGKHLVQGLKISGSKSTYNVGADSTAETSKSLHKLADSVAGFDEGDISLLNTAGDHEDFMQGRRASCNPTPTTSKWHKFTSSSKNTNIPTLNSFSTSDLNKLL